MADMASRKSSTDVLGNSAWNAIAFAVAVALNLLVLPFVVFRLGVAAFGVAGLVTACVAPALAFSNALALSTTRELAQRLEPSERDDARRLFATAVMLALAAGGVIAILFGLAGAPLARLGFHLSGPSADDLGLAFALASAGWLCQCLSAVFLALFTARQDYRRVASISIISTVVATAPCCCSFRAGRRPRRFLAVRRWVLQRACFWPSDGPDASSAIGWRARRFIVGRSVNWSSWAAGNWPRRAARSLPRRRIVTCSELCCSRSSSAFIRLRSGWKRRCISVS